MTAGSSCTPAVAALGILLFAAMAPVVAAPQDPATDSTSDAIIGLPAVTGELPVGTFTEFWSDPTRNEGTSRGVVPRAVAVQLWYPAERTPVRILAPYAPGVRATDGDYGKLVNRVRGSAALKAPAAKEIPRAPVVVFSTGRSLAAYDYSSIAEDLASHGFVVVGVNSPHLSRYWTEGGEVVPPAPAPPTRVLQNFDEADVYFEPMVHDVVADLRFVVDRLEEVDRSDPILGGRLDRKRLALMGHSNGALAASRACAEDRRCRTFLGIEGTQTREIRKEGVRKPYGLLISEQSLGLDAQNVYRELGTLRGTDFTVVVLKGAGHNSITDLPLVRPEEFTYAMASRRGLQIARVAVRAFLEEHLLDRRAALRSALAGMPEVEIQKEFPSRER